MEKIYLAPTLIKESAAFNFSFRFQIDKTLKKQIKSDKKYNIKVYCLKGLSPFEFLSYLKWPEKPQITFNDNNINNFKSSISFNISNLISDENLIEIKNQKISDNFIMVIILTKPISVEHFLKNLNIPKLSKIDAKNLLLNDEAGGIVSKEQVQFKDTHTQKLIKTPVRGRHCLHFTCFDLIPFILFSWRKASSSCPVCKEVVYFSDLIEDSYFKSMIEEAAEKYGEDLDQYAVFLENGKI